MCERINFGAFKVTVVSDIVRSLVAAGAGAEGLLSIRTALTPPVAATSVAPPKRIRGAAFCWFHRIFGRWHAFHARGGGEACD